MTRRRMLASGRRVGGGALTNGPLAYMLDNRMYLGEINHRDESFPSEHPPIVDIDLFEAMQEKLSENLRGRRLRRRSSNALLLGGSMNSDTGIMDDEVWEPDTILDSLGGRFQLCVCTPSATTRWLNFLPAKHTIAVGGTSKDFWNAFERYRKSAEQKVLAVQAPLGLMYADGHGVSRDFRSAAYWLKLIVLGNSPEVQVTIGKMYIDRDGVRTNYKRAFDLLHRACAQGVIQANYELGSAYLDGRGTTRNVKRALKHFEDGSAGCLDCQCALGTMYALGDDGVAINRKKALWWLKLAGELGHIMSQVTREALFPDERGRPRLEPKLLSKAGPIIAQLRERAKAR